MELIPLDFVAAAIAIMLMCGFYFAVAYFGLRLLFKKVLRRSVDPAMLMAAITIGVVLILIGQRLWYHQPFEPALVLMPIAVTAVLLRRIRMQGRKK
ncbi:hypothetical protein ACTHPF_20180 [Paenibacillus sp. SAF-054]|uniref:hypothetical protein n=1 Tax=unclassified Paenibacillus TaxID=185978 RepID=UPI003F7D53E4